MVPANRDRLAKESCGFENSVTHVSFVRGEDLWCAKAKTSLTSFVLLPRPIKIAQITITICMRFAEYPQVVTDTEVYGAQKQGRARRPGHGMHGDQQRRVLPDHQYLRNDRLGVGQHHDRERHELEAAMLMLKHKNWLLNPVAAMSSRRQRPQENTSSVIKRVNESPSRRE